MTRRQVALAYQPTGFPRRGGLQRLALNVIEHLGRCGAGLSLLVAARGRQGGTDGAIGLPTRTNLEGVEVLVVLGCDQPWAYAQVLAQRLRRPRRQVHWLPSFHDPQTVAHPWRARLAGSVLKLMQRLGCQVHVQTQQEHRLLDAGRCHLSSHALGADLRQQLLAAEPPEPSEERPLDLLFLGRPTLQKGWRRFLRVAGHASDLRCAAIVPFLSEVERQAADAVGLKILLDPDPGAIPFWLRSTKVVLIPADYESFGLAQLEALAQGCLVPILGHWPLWERLVPLQWQGWSEARLATACLELCQDPQQRSRLVALQQAYLRSHPIQTTPFLPGLLMGTLDG